jgi:hypothetical protein
MDKGCGAAQQTGVINGLFIPLPLNEETIAATPDYSNGNGNL